MARTLLICFPSVDGLYATDCSWGANTGSNNAENGGPYTPPFLQCRCAPLLLCVFEVEAIEVHHLDPRVHELRHEPVLAIGFGIDLRNSAKLGV